MAVDSPSMRGNSEVADGSDATVLDGEDEAPVANGVGSKVLKQGETTRKMSLNGKRQEVAGWWRSSKRVAVATL
jgi:hypothetical protein